jgi:hypothetical protein
MDREAQETSLFFKMRKKISIISINPISFFKTVKQSYIYISIVFVILL